jgi:hypothetical protein
MYPSARRYEALNLVMISVPDASVPRDINLEAVAAKADCTAPEYQKQPDDIATFVINIKGHLIPGERKSP